MGAGVDRLVDRPTLDSYLARDVQELFRLKKRSAFLCLLELLLRQSGGMLDVAKLATENEVSRPTVTNWLEIYQITHVAHVLRPFSAGGRREVIAQPKVFGFDTGLVCHARGWDSLRADDCGTLWEHLVLDTLIAAGVPKIHYWRDKQQREVDFVVLTGRDDVDAIECKWSPEAFEARGLKAFREYYTSGKNYVVCPLSGPGYERVYEGLTVTVVSPGELRQRMNLLFGLPSADNPGSVNQSKREVGGLSLNPKKQIRTLYSRCRAETRASTSAWLL